MIKVLHPQSVEIDGANYGAVADAIANNPQLAAQIQLALNAWYGELQATHEQAIAALNDAQATAQQEQQHTIANLQTQLANMPTLQAENDSLKAQLNALQNPPKPVQNYVGLFNSLLTEGLQLFLFVRSACDQSLPVSNAYSDLSDALITPTPSPEALQSCINNLFASIQGSGFVFPETLATLMRHLLDKNGFSAIIFPLFRE